MSELSPEQMDIVALFVINLQNGGIEAARRMERTLLDEAKAAILASRDEVILPQGTDVSRVISPEELVATLKLADDLGHKAIAATLRYSFVSYLLGRTERAFGCL